MSCLVYLLVWSPPPHIPYISSPNQCLLFAAHAHTIAACFAVISVLYHLFLRYRYRYLLTLLWLESRITCYEQKCLKATNMTHNKSGGKESFSQLLTWKSVLYLNITHPSDHSHLCSLKRHLLCTQLLYSLPLLIIDIGPIPIGKQWYQLAEFIPST